MEVIYRPLLPTTQYCPCAAWQSKSPRLSSLSNQPSPFFRALFAPYTPLWIDSAPAITDNSPDVSAPSQQADINYRAIFERQQKNATRSVDATGLMASIYMPKGRWHWTYQVPFEDRSEQISISSDRRYSLSVRTARMYNERITYVRKLWPRGSQWEGFFSEVWLHKGQLRPLHGTIVPALIGIHSNIEGIQMTYDIPHHSFWIQASPDMPIVLKRRCLDAYHQLHGQGVLHGSVTLANILIGGDGQVKIMNFEKSRSDRSESRVGLRLATPQDFKMEMREVHYKLDYLGAREKELAAWENRHGLRQIQPPRKNRSKKLYDRAPYTVSLEPPVDPFTWLVPDDWKPARFVVPGQSVQQFEHHLNKFLLELDEPDRRIKKNPSSRITSLPGPPAPPSGKGPIAVIDRDPANRGAGQRYNLRKRKLREIQSDDSDEDSSTKRVRFLAVTQHDDGTRGEVRSPLPPGVKRQVPRTSREHEKPEHPFAQNERRLEARSATYSPASRSTCPEILPKVNYEELFSAWRSSCARSEKHRKDYGDGDSEEGSGGLSERVLGKRRQADDGDSRENDIRQPKRLRRSETTVWEGDSLDTNLPTSSTSEARRAAQPRRVTRSSTRGLRPSSQPVAGPSIPSPKVSAEGPIQVIHGNSHSDKVSQTTKWVGIAPSSASSMAKQLPTSPLAEYDPRATDFGKPSNKSVQVGASPPLSTPNNKGNPLGIQVLTSVATSHGLTSSVANRVHGSASQLRETTPLQSGGESLATTDSFESIDLVYDEPTQPVRPAGPLPPSALITTHTSTETPRLWQEPTSMGMTRVGAGRLPSSILTIASKIRGIVGLW